MGVPVVNYTRFLTISTFGDSIGMSLDQSTERYGYGTGTEQASIFQPVLKTSRRKPGKIYSTNKKKFLDKVVKFKKI